MSMCMTFINKSLGALCDLDRSASLGLLIGLLVGEYSLKDFMPKT